MAAEYTRFASQNPEELVRVLKLVFPGEIMNQDFVIDFQPLNGIYSVGLVARLRFPLWSRVTDGVYISGGVIATRF